MADLYFGQDEKFLLKTSRFKLNFLRLTDPEQ